MAVATAHVQVLEVVQAAFLHLPLVAPDAMLQIISSIQSEF